MLLTTREMAEELGVCDATVHRMQADGRIPPEYTTKIGDRWRYNGEKIVEHLLAQEFEPPRNP